jgi:hypothetical protein
MMCFIPAESLCVEIASQVLKQRNVELTKEAQRAALGKRPLDCWRDVVNILGIKDATAEELFEETEPLLQARCAPMKRAIAAAAAAAAVGSGHKQQLVRLMIKEHGPMVSEDLFMQRALGRETPCPAINTDNHKLLCRSSTPADCLDNC